VVRSTTWCLENTQSHIFVQKQNTINEISNSTILNALQTMKRYQFKHPRYFDEIQNDEIKKMESNEDAD